MSNGTETDILTAEGEVTIQRGDRHNPCTLELVLSEMDVMSTLDPRYAECCECHRRIRPGELQICFDCMLEKKRENGFNPE